PSTRSLTMRWRAEWMQYACVGLKARWGDGREHTGVERREAAADPCGFLNFDALLHTRLSHESIIHGTENTYAGLRPADPVPPRIRARSGREAGLRVVR
ncbi:MAG: hypothetical protein ACRDPA_13400, partial [Solirubrobacteraceae bacterium]